MKGNTLIISNLMFIDNKLIMGSIKISIKEQMKRFRPLYYGYRELIKQREERKRMWKEAVKMFDEEHPEHGTLADYKHALFRHRVSYDEYMKCYEFWNLDEKQRDEFISEMEMRCIYRKTVQVSFDRLCSNKDYLLKRFDRYVHRQWRNVGSMSFEGLKDFVSSTDCIAKPIFGTLGRGVFMIRRDDSQNWQGLYDYCCKNNFLIEERIRACKEIEEFHPQSLNTIRVYTISKDGRCELVASELRVGVGENVVDNASAGGIVAAINLETGAIIGDGADKAGKRYEVHPDTGKAFKGFVIPHWQEVVSLCKEMSIVVPEMVFAGWDICVLQDGDVEMMEVNSYPNVSGLQTAYQRGLKPKIRSIGKDVLGYDPVKLISVWSKSYVKYEGIYGKY